jgi:hypothetical protein
VHQKWFLSVLHVQHKPCPNLALRLTLSPNTPKLLPFDPCHLGGPLGVAKNISMPVEYSVHIVHLACAESNTICKWKKWASTWPMSHRSSIGCTQNDFLAYCMCWRKPCTYLASRFTLSPNTPKWASIWPTSPRRSLGSSQKDFLARGHIRRKSCTYLVPRLTLFPIEPNRASTWPTSSMSSIRCSHNKFWAIVHSSQTVHLYCTEINTNSKQT